MKTTNHNIALCDIRALVAAWVAILSMLAAGCSDSMLPDDALHGGGMTELTLQFDVDVPSGENRTRADAMGNTDVRSLWVGVYDITTGNRVGAKECEIKGSKVELPVVFYDAHPTVAIVGVANYGGVSDWDGALLSERLAAADTWDRFVDIDVRVPLVDGAPVADFNGPQLMMGLLTEAGAARAFYKKSDTGSVAVEHLGAESYSVNLSPTSLYGSMIHSISGKRLYLRRLHTQVNVNISSGANASVADVSFRRCNMPKGVYLAERPTYTPTLTDVKSWNTFSANTPNLADQKMSVANAQVTNSDSYYSDGADEWIPAGRDNKFSFTHYENRHWGVNSTSSNHANREKLSDKARGNVEGLGHEYNNYASYFVIRMTILDKDNGGRSAQVEYVIHEGNVNDQYGEETDNNNKGRDYCAFRGMVYNYNITVNGIDYITQNITTGNHNDAASGVIWDARISTVNNYSGNITVESNQNLLFRFYVGNGDYAPQDYISGTIPDDMAGMYWPLIDNNTQRNGNLNDVSSFFTIRKNNATNYTPQAFVNDARNSGGTYTITLNPQVRTAQWTPEAYRIGLYYYNPSETSNLRGQDSDGCTRYTNKVVHVLEWMPAQREPAKLNQLNNYYFTNPTVMNYVTEYAELDFSTAHYYSGNNNTGNYGVYGIDYQYVVTVNGRQYVLGSDMKCKVHMSILNNGNTSYYVQAVALNTKQVTSSDTTSGTIYVTTPGTWWDFSTDDFVQDFFRKHFYTETGRYKAPEDQDLKKFWDRNGGLYVCVGSGNEIGRINETSPAYLYFNNSGSASKDINCIIFTVYKSCKVKVVTYTKNGPRALNITGGYPDSHNLQHTNADEEWESGIYVEEGGSQKVKIYYTGGGAYLKSVNLSNY